jgi:DNA-binding MarR family transcriptional regulator
MTRDLADAVFVAAAWCEARLDLVLAGDGLDVAEWRLLRALYAAGPQPPSALAAQLHLTRGGITRIADRLRTRRLLVRVPGGQGDRRYQTLALTGGGARLVERLSESADTAAHAGLAPAERERLAALLHALVAADVP